MKTFIFYVVVVLLALNIWADYLRFRAIYDLRKEILKTQIEVLKLKIALNEAELKRLNYLTNETNH